VVPSDTAETEPEAVPALKRRGLWPAVAAVMGVMGALAIWVAGQSGSAESGSGPQKLPAAQATAAATMAASVPAPAAASVGAPPPVEAVDATQPAAATPLESADNAHFQELVRREAERAEKARRSVARMAAQEEAARQAREKKLAIERQRLETARQAPDQAMAPETNASNPAVPALAAPAPTPAIRPSVEQACASATNFFSRDLCRIAACREAGNARDPICVRYRQIEEERRNRVNP
jgi:hypothetical protein